MEQNLLSIRDLRTVLPLKDGSFAAPVDQISLNVPSGKVVGLVGESGCGKSMTARSIIRLLEQPIFIREGKIEFQCSSGEVVDLVSLPMKQMRTIRGKEISMIFQEPMTALNPSITVGKQVLEAITIHERIPRKEAVEQVLQSFRDVGISEPERRYKSYPHQLSGGLRQRICIAMAMILKPSLLIADEPTTALDVTVEAQILSLMKNLQRSRNMSVLLITHNLGVVADICDEVNVMYAGQIVEYASKGELFHRTAHPYTQGLMQAIPRVRGAQQDELYTIHGTVPSLSEMPTACRFAGRCPYATDRCRAEEPQLRDIGGGHLVRCFREVTA